MEENPRAGRRRLWAYSGRPARPRPGDVEAFEQSLAERLRSGQAVPVAIALTWLTGADGGVQVEPLGRESNAWWRDVVVSGYPAMAWRPMEVPADTAAVGWHGRPLAEDSCPFRPIAPGPWSDALAPVLRTLPTGGSVRWVLRGGGRPEDAPVLRPDDGIRVVPPGVRTLGPAHRPAREAEDLRALRVLQPRWAAEVVIAGTRPAGDSTAPALARAVTALSRHEGGNGLVFSRSSAWWNRGRAFLLTGPEVLGLLPTPWSPWGNPAERAPPGTRSWRIGRDGIGRPIDRPVEPGNGAHVLVVGETGMGKSTLLIRMAEAAVRLGSVVVLDPVGDTGREVLGRVPRDRVPSATWIAPMDSPIAMNALGAAHGPSPRAERAVGDLVGALRRVRSARFESTPFWGPRLEEAAHWALSAAAGMPEGSLVEAEQLLADPFRLPQPVRGEAAETGLRALRDRARDRPDELEGARRMLAEALRTSTLRELLSDPRARWTPQSALVPGAVTVVTGDAPAVGASTARALLSMYLAVLASALVARPANTPVFLLLEEAPWYAHEALTDLLRMGRRWGLHLVVATQSLEAFPPELREALWTNVADQIRFRGSPSEARELERWGAGLTTEELVGLPRGVAAALLGKGRELRWLVTDPARGPEDASSRRAEIAESSRSRWGPPVALEAGPTADGGPEPGTERDARWSPEVGGVLRVFATLCAAASGPEVAVPLAEWRSTGAVPESAIRAAGRLLAGAGVLRSEHGASGTVWWVDRKRFTAWFRSGDPSDRT